MCVSKNHEGRWRGEGVSGAGGRVALHSTLYMLQYEEEGGFRRRVRKPSYRGTLPVK